MSPPDLFSQSPPTLSVLPAASPAGIGEHAALHPSVWLAHELGRPLVTEGCQAVTSGHSVLDAQLPGGGWPLGALTELLLPHDGLGELRLLAPALAAVQQRNQASRGLMWFDPPAEPCGWVLTALGIDLRRLVVVRPRPLLPGRPPLQRRGSRTQLPAADVLWALEQALKSGQLGGVLAWFPSRLPADALRRLQLAAQAHEGPVFLLRSASEALQPSAAPLRIALASAGPDRLRLVLLKRRGPPAAEPIEVWLPPVLPESSLRYRGLVPAHASAGRPVPWPAPAEPCQAQGNGRWAHSG